MTVEDFKLRFFESGEEFSEAVSTIQLHAWQTVVQLF